tara:strand:+ start:9837 stop:10028 length:192 start_codon:yes stop_codon:yes gene_type:complete
MAIITLSKDWVSGQGKKLKPGDKVDICRETYDNLKNEGICEAYPEWDVKPKKKVKKAEPKKEK